MARVRVTVVTYRRPHLLERALRGLIAQGLTDWTAEVLNDDPADPAPVRMVQALGDPRVAIVEPPRHRGGTENFNHAFRQDETPFASLLEDDNWWEPDFLSEMVDALERRPDVALVTGNERVWQEDASRDWHDTGRTLRPDTARVWDYPLRAEDKCGGSVLCNSAMVFRPSAVRDWRVPSVVPVDVTELYRERLVPHPFLVHDRALVNFGATRETHRSADPFDWNSHQVLLTASIFAVLPESERPRLAAALWENARGRQPLTRTTLLLAGRHVPEARALWTAGRAAEKIALAAHLASHPGHERRYRRLLDDHETEWRFLQQGWVAQALGAAVSA